MSFAIETRDFSLSETLECGQCFRWRRIAENKYRGIANCALLTLTQSGAKLVVEGASQENCENWLKAYLSLDEPYEKYKSLLSEDETLKTAIGYAPGIRVMKQPLWETLISFIISQNNNIARIMRIVDSLCRHFGEDLGGFFDFPTPATLAALKTEDLSPLVCGYRDVYIIDAAQRYAAGEIDEAFLRSAPLDEARRQLLSIKGVGPKVADCVLLFGAHRLEAFPRDVWIKRAMSALFPDGLPESALPIAGIAQQYIFHYARKSGVFD
ncbi:MAG: DNA glycosylase [Oscillospiraceae bacterium]|nr:DNA glycosylase [Oscillospiraceae bacterium]